MLAFFIAILLLNCPTHYTLIISKCLMVVTISIVILKTKHFHIVAVVGQTGHVHKFLMACLVQNVFNAYKSINNDESKSNKAMCIELSDALYIYSQEFYDFGN